MNNLIHGLLFSATKCNIKQKEEEKHTQLCCEEDK